MMSAYDAYRFALGNVKELAEKRNCPSVCHPRLGLFPYRDQKRVIALFHNPLLFALGKDFNLDIHDKSISHE